MDFVHFPMLVARLLFDYVQLIVRVIVRMCDATVDEFFDHVHEEESNSDQKLRERVVLQAVVIGTRRIVSGVCWLVGRVDMTTIHFLGPVFERFAHFGKHVNQTCREQNSAAERHEKREDLGHQFRRFDVHSGRARLPEHDQRRQRAHCERGHEQSSRCNQLAR